MTFVWAFMCVCICIHIYICSFNAANIEMRTSPMGKYVVASKKASTSSSSKAVTVAVIEDAHTDADAHADADADAAGTLRGWRAHVGGAKNEDILVCTKFNSFRFDVMLIVRSDRFDWNVSRFTIVLMLLAGNGFWCLCKP